jgi:hypothetical protein
MCRRGRCLPSWSVGEAAQPCAIGCSEIQLVVYGRSRRCDRFRKIRTPQRRATGTGKSLCRQGDTQRVAPTLLTCPTGYAACCLHRFALRCSTHPATVRPHRHRCTDDAHFSHRPEAAPIQPRTLRFEQKEIAFLQARELSSVFAFLYRYRPRIKGAERSCW